LKKYVKNDNQLNNFDIFTALNGVILKINDYEKKYCSRQLEDE